MTKHFSGRPLVAGALSFTVFSTLTSAAAMAACGAAATLAGLSSIVGPPSITATESSTDQALELIRRRREEASGMCPQGFIRSGGNCVPAASPASATVVAQAPTPPPVTVTTTTTAGQAAPPAAAPAAGASASPLPKQARPRPAPKAAPSQQVAAAAPPQAGYGFGSIKDDVPAPVGGVVRMRGAWSEGYFDHEKRDNLAPNRTVPAFTATVSQNGVLSARTVDSPVQRINQSRKTSSGGFVSGVDMSEFEIGTSIRGWQLGFFSGYNSTRSRLSDITVLGQGINQNTGLPDGLTITSINSDTQEVRGAFGGLYGTIVHGKFSADMAFKVDFFDVERSFTESFFFDPNCAPPGDIVNTTTLRRDSTTMTNYTVASNANYRFDMSPSFYLEPTVGVRWTFSDFGNNAAALGLKDGDMFRLQGGLRLGNRVITQDGWVWNNSITGLLYSDVAINGYSTGGTGPGGIAPVDPRIDEGKLRVMGILESRVDVGYGYTLYGIGDVRGGDDYIGYGIRGGVRYQW